MSSLVAHIPYDVSVNVPNIYWHYFLRIVYTAKEYERVVGWEGSIAVSPPRDGAAWALRNGRNFLRG